MGPSESNVYSTPNGPGTTAPPASMPGAGTPVNDAISQLTQLRQQLVAKQSVLDQAAMKPQAGGPVAPTGGISVPGGGNTMAPLSQRQAVGAKDARHLGIANTVIGAMNLLGQVSNQRAAHQQEQVAQDTQRVLTAQAAMQQAKDVLANDPNNKAAQESLKANTDLINMMDPKKLKAVGKALDINFVDPSKNNKPEHAAGQKAIASYAEQLSKQLPQTLAPNQQAVAAAEQNRQNIEGLDKYVKAISPIEVATINTESKERVAQVQQNGADKRQNQKEAWQMAFEKYKEQTHHVDKMAEIQMQGNQHVRGILAAQNAIDRRFYDGLDQKITAAKGKLENMQSKDLEQSINNIQKQLKTETAQQKTLIQLRDHLVKKAKTPEEKQRLDTYNNLIHHNEEDMKNLPAMLDGFNAEMKRRVDANAGDNAKRTANATGGTASTEAATPVSAKTADDSEPEAPTNSDGYGNEDSGSD